MNELAAVQKKFAELDVERLIRAEARTARRELRRKTRAAQLGDVARRRDIERGRPARELTEEEARLIDGAPTLRARLKEQKATERRYWASLPHHQILPEAKWRAAAEARAAEAAARALSEVTSQMGYDLADAAQREAARKVMRAAALDAAHKEVGYKDAAPIVAHEIAAAAARAALGESSPAPIESAAEAAATAAAAAVGMKPPIEAPARERRERARAREVETMERIEREKAQRTDAAADDASESDGGADGESDDGVQLEGNSEAEDGEVMLEENEGDGGGGADGEKPGILV